jgi:two-component system sensor histidine kinase RegB
MGLGIFIAKTLLERSGAEVEFANRTEGGAEVVIRWNGPILEMWADRQDEP